MKIASSMDDRPAVVECLHAALSALQAGDTHAWRSNVDELLQWRTQPLVQGLAKLELELEHALGDSAGHGGGGSLPDACARLEHVVRVSEDASHQTLDLIHDCGVLLGTLPDVASTQAATVAAIRSRLSEMTAAQGYQDFTAQIIRRVVEIVRAAHAGLGTVAGDHPVLSLSAHGPSTARLEPPAEPPDDASQLLSAFGL